MTNAFKLTLIWILGCMLAFMIALNYLPAALVDGHYIPAGNDAFYHARRILDTVADPAAFFQFDPHVHYPDGSWISWPWGYDYLMAAIVRGYLHVFGPRDPMAVLAYIPVFAITITMALLVGIVSLLQLSMAMRLLAVVCFALSTCTQVLHGVGSIDHHFVEHIFYLATVAAGMYWLIATQNWARAALLGFVLGVAIAFHNGLFILQAFVLTVLLVLWMRGTMIERRAALALSGALLAGTMMAALPSEPLRNGAFEFYLLSWFHVYCAGCTALFVLLLSRLEFNARHLLALGGVALVLLVPLGAHLAVGESFVTTSMDMLQGVAEARRPLTLLTDSAGVTYLSGLYGLFFWLIPLLLIVMAVRIFRERRAEFVYFWIVAAFGLLLLLQQIRFQYYGSLALYVMPFWCADALIRSKPRWARLAVPGAVLFAALMLAPVLRMHVLARHVPGLEDAYTAMRKVFPPLARACKAAPGLALVNTDEGHYVRYHTDCDVIANNFRMTPQDDQKIREVAHLYSLTPEQLLIEAPQVRYVVVSLYGPYEYLPPDPTKPMPLEEVVKMNSQLTRDLLFRDPQQLPARFHLLFSLNHDEQSKVPLIRLYEIRPAPSLAAR